MGVEIVPTHYENGQVVKKHQRMGHDDFGAYDVYELDYIEKSVEDWVKGTSAYMAAAFLKIVKILDTDRMQKPLFFYGYKCGTNGSPTHDRKVIVKIPDGRITSRLVFDLIHKLMTEHGCVAFSKLMLDRKPSM